jgi:CSLREA domain-containing protein
MAEEGKVAQMRVEHWRSISLLRLVVLVCLALAVRSAAAATLVYNVNSFADVIDPNINGICDTGGGVCTLRAAIMEANGSSHSHSDAVTINLQAGTYTLTIPIDANDDLRSGDLNLAFNTRLQGAGMNLTTIDANHVDRAIYVHGAADVTLADLTVQGGRPPANASRATEGHGGGIYVNEGSLTLLRTIVRDNVTIPPYNGGGVYIVGGLLGGSLTVTSSMVRVNTARYGGGIFSYQAPVSIEGSSVYSNQALYSGGGGGGIFINGSSLTAWNSSIGSNSANAFGGGVYLVGATATLNNVTLAGSFADSDADGFGSGGGIALGSSSAILSNSVLINQINSPAGSYANDFSCGSSTVTSNGFNIVNAPGACVTSGAVLEVAPFLAGFALNGGLTVTQLPNPGSPAIGAGKPTGCVTPLGAPLLTDQRGVKRPIGGACDLGSLEVEPKGDVNGDGIVAIGDVFYLINYLFAGGPIPPGRASVDGIAAIDVSDVFYLINYLFAGGPAPA